MLGFFKKKVVKQMDQIKKFERKDLAEAAIGAAVLLAAADNGVSDEEVITIMGLVQNMDQFKHHQSEIETMITKYTGLLKSGFLVGKITIMREIADVKGNEEEIEDDFTSRFLSIIIDATFILAALYLLKDYLRQDIGKQHTKKDTESGKSTSTH
jgi:tellurite resistance protein TerB